MGGPKTGTSAIQAFLAKNRRKLEQDGVVYPAIENLAAAETGGVTSGNGIGVALAFQQGESQQLEAYRSYLKELKSSPAPAVLISSEHFAYAKKEHLESIKADVEATGRRLKLILYIRPQIESVISFYAQRIKRHSEVGILERFWREHERAFDYLPRITQYADVVSLENFTLRNYLRESLVEKDVISDFGSVLGIDFTSYERFSYEINPTPNAYDLALLRYLNRFKTEEHKFAISDAFMRIMAQEQQAKQKELKMWVSDVLEAKISAHYKEANEKISKNYLNNAPFAADSGKPDQFVEADRLPNLGPMIKGVAKLYLSMFNTISKQQRDIDELQRHSGIPKN